jgi:hypothetical protein
MQTPSRQSIVQRDQFLGERIDYIRAHFDPASTVVLAGSWNFRHPDFYLSEYQMTALSYQLGDEAVMLPAQVRTLVLFDDDILPQISGQDSFDAVSLAGAGQLRFTTWQGPRQVLLSQTSFEIK